MSCPEPFSGPTEPGSYPPAPAGGLQPLPDQGRGHGRGRPPADLARRAPAQALGLAEPVPSSSQAPTQPPEQVFCKRKKKVLRVKSSGMQLEKSSTFAGERLRGFLQASQTPLPAPRKSKRNLALWSFDNPWKIPQILKQHGWSCLLSHCSLWLSVLSPSSHSNPILGLKVKGVCTEQVPTEGVDSCTWGKTLRQINGARGMEAECCLPVDGDQNMPPQNRPLGQKDYFYTEGTGDSTDKAKKKKSL